MIQLIGIVSKHKKESSASSESLAFESLRVGPIFAWRTRDSSRNGTKKGERQVQLTRKAQEQTWSVICATCK